MATRARRRQLIATIVALVVVLPLLFLGISAVSGSGSGSAPAAAPATDPGATTVPPPTASVPPSTASVPPSTASVPSPTASVPPSTASVPSSTAAPTAADVAAARACQAFTIYLEDAEKGDVPAAAGRTLVDDAAVLVDGARQDQATDKPEPQWAALGSDLLAAAEDVVKKDASALDKDGAAAGKQCQLVPVAAARAGGFERSS